MPSPSFLNEEINRLVLDYNATSLFSAGPVTTVRDYLTGANTVRFNATYFGEFKTILSIMAQFPNDFLKNAYMEAIPDADYDVIRILSSFYVRSDMETFKVPLFYRSGSAIACDWLSYEDPINLRRVYKKFTQENLNRYTCHPRNFASMIQFADWSETLWLLAPAFNFYIPFQHTFVSHGPTSEAYSTALTVAAREEARMVINWDENRSLFVFGVDVPNVLPEFQRIRQLLSYSTDVPRLLGITERRTEKDTKSTPLYGVELELSTNATVYETVSSFGEVFGVCKSDGSITGNKRNRYEVVTVPATLRYHRKMWYNFFKQDMTQYDTSLDTNNGMHVHIGRDAFTSMKWDGEEMVREKNDNHILRFSYFWNNLANRWFIVQMSERSQDNIDHYCNFAPLSSFTTTGKQYANTVKVADHGKMFAINHTKRHTVEVRIFKGVVSYASVMKNLELVDAVLRYTELCSIKECDVVGLLQWLDKTPKSEYRALKLYLRSCLDLNDARIVTDFLRNTPKIVNGDELNLTGRQRTLIALSNPKYKTPLSARNYSPPVVSSCLDLDSILMTRKV